MLDKDVYIATVSEGGKLDMEMRLKRGRGYVSADKNFDEDLGHRLHSDGLGALAGAQVSTTLWKPRVWDRSPTTTS